MKQTILKISLIVALALALFFTGRWTKKCFIVDSIVYKTDTVVQYVTSSPLILKSKPVNIPGKTIYLKNEAAPLLPNYGFLSKDTLRWDGGFVAIQDSGDCSGILDRQSYIENKIKERIITKEIAKTIVKTPPLVQLNAGLQVSSNMDLGPMVTFDIKHKVAVGYSYMMNNSTHNLSLTFKIK